jgi:hypothetical protein
MTRLDLTRAASELAREIDSHGRSRGVRGLHLSMQPPPGAPISGRYAGLSDGYEVELRVDVDGECPMHRVSADYFQLHRGKRRYHGSMRVDAPAVAVAGSATTITGSARPTWQTDADRIRITVAWNTTAAEPHLTLRHIDRQGRTCAQYVCVRTSTCFRTLSLEEDEEQGVQCFESYDIASLPAPCAPRTLTHLSAFEEAGVEVVRTRERGELRSPGVSWSDAELHAAMVRRFTAFADAPQWAMWLLHARLHDRDRTSNTASVVGLMFDQRGRQRQGCAVFYNAMKSMGGSAAQGLRTQLFACVHEMAHAFNLLHSFQKSLAIPPVPSRPESATWMAYPALYPGGEEAFWAAFGFAFDDAELVHLRHAVRDDIIMGGNPFRAGAALTQEALDGDAQQEDPGLRLRLSAATHIPFGLPVTVEFTLWGTTQEGRTAPRVLGPRPGNVDVVVRGPDGRAKSFEPLLRHCRVADAVTLRAGDEPVRDSAFLHYGKDRFAFDTPGRYELIARCVTPNGATVLSNVVRIVVQPPVTRADREVAELVFDTQQGQLLSLVGSDAPSLRKGDEALQSIIERHPRHPVASVARVVRAINAAREFKVPQRDGLVRVRKPDPQEAAAILYDTPGLNALRRATAGTSDRKAIRRTIVRQLSRMGGTAPADRYIRSRVNEIAVVMPEVLEAASVRRPVAGPRPRARTT